MAPHKWIAEDGTSVARFCPLDALEFKTPADFGRGHAEVVLTLKGKVTLPEELTEAREVYDFHPDDWPLFDAAFRQRWAQG